MNAPDGTEGRTVQPEGELLGLGRGGNGEAVCPVCGRRFGKRSRNHRYCSKACKQRGMND